jgi:hypothetical protein
MTDFEAPNTNIPSHKLKTARNLEPEKNGCALNVAIYKLLGVLYKVK